MQLNNYLLVILFLAFTFNVQAQDAADSTKVHLEDVSIDFLFNYYEQDGIHSPVTGGQGTEKLNNIAPTIFVNIPLSKKTSFSYNGGIDFYSSASSDNINNPYLQADHVSGPSASDFRIYSNIGVKQKNLKKRFIYGANLGLSFEYDVFSVSAGGSFTTISANENNEFTVKANYFVDQWKIILPIEHRNASVNPIDFDLRHSYSLSLIDSWVMTKRMNASVNLDLVFQNGLLSTPFHRVYFDDYITDLLGSNTTDDLINSNVEKLPNQRFKLPIGFRYNYYLSDIVLLKAYYRFYWDSWNVTGNTIQVDLPIKIKNFMRIYPFYRFHYQTAAKYFAPFAAHSATETYYTSDFDLSGFTSHKVGLGVSYSPLYGVFSFRSKDKKRNNMLKSIDLRYAHYRRSDGLKANIYSIGLNYLIKR